MLLPSGSLANKTPLPESGISAMLDFFPFSFSPPWLAMSYTVRFSVFVCIQR